jgi:predicted PurR-regulated permease PerM
METIILISVLTTLGAVAILTSIVVAFIKLKNKVDGNSLNITIRDIHQRIDDLNNETGDRFDRLITHVYETINHNHNETSNEFEDVKRIIDSRCDKLDAKIKVKSEYTPKIEKQILKD